MHKKHIKQDVRIANVRRAKQHKHDDIALILNVISAKIIGGHAKRIKRVVEKIELEVIKENIKATIVK